MHSSSRWPTSSPRSFRRRVLWPTSAVALAPGLVRFYDAGSLCRLIEDQGLSVIDCGSEPGRVTVLARG